MPAILFYMSGAAGDRRHLAVKDGLVGIPKEQLPKPPRSCAREGADVCPDPVYYRGDHRGLEPHARGGVLGDSLWCWRWLCLSKATRPNIKLVLKALMSGALSRCPDYRGYLRYGRNHRRRDRHDRAGGEAQLHVNQHRKGGNVYIAAVLAAVITIVLGCGMPPTPVYVLRHRAGAPADADGVAPIAAHMFIFIFSCIGALTPPVAITAYLQPPSPRRTPIKPALRPSGGACGLHHSLYFPALSGNSDGGGDFRGGGG